MKDNSNSLFIVFEGMDLSGKTTQAKMLQQWFIQEKKQKSIFTQEPTEKGLLGRILRMSLQGMLRTITDENDLLSEEIVRAKLFALDRFIHLKNEIEPSLNDGCHVISDRYYLSSLAYQSVELLNLGYSLMPAMERVKQLNSDALYASTQPDIIILIDITVQAWRQRKSLRITENGGQITEIYEEEKKLYKIRDQYHRAIEFLSTDEKLRNIRIEIIKYEDGFTNRILVHKEVVRLVKGCIPQKTNVAELPLFGNADD